MSLITVLVLLTNKYRKDFFINCPNVFWIHTVLPFGEVRAVEPALDSFEGKYYIVLTSTTKSGREYAQKLPKVDFVALLPLDIYLFMHRAFDIIKPDILVLVETELWVTMLYTVARENIKVGTINGRMSDKSFEGYKKLKFFWSKFVGLIDVVIARSNNDDAGRFAFLTDEKSKIVVSGNIKYDRDFKLNSKREISL